MSTSRRPRRGFGKIRRLPSKRYQASYVGPDLNRHPAPRTFEAREDAEAWLSVERRLVNEPDMWTSPIAREKERTAGLTLCEFASAAVHRRRSRGTPLKPRTLSLYESLLDRLILPELGDRPMRTITRDDVQRWHDGLDPRQPTQRAHAYALLKSLLDQAQGEGRLTISNPCTIKGAGVTRRRRKVVPVSLVDLNTIVAAMPARLRPLVLLAAWCGLRFGELAELRRKDVDLPRQVLHVHRAMVRVNGAEVIGSPKSEAGVRDVALPPHLLPVLRDHLATEVGRGRESLLFPHHPGGNKHWTHGMFYKVWMPARAAAGREDLRLHDLRHSAAVMAAQTGATLAELMARLGHSTPAAALRYQHAAQGRDAQIAAALSAFAESSVGGAPQ